MNDALRRGDVARRGGRRGPVYRVAPNRSGLAPGMNPLRLYRQGILVSVLRNADGAWQGTLRERGRPLRLLGVYARHWDYRCPVSPPPIPYRPASMPCTNCYVSPAQCEDGPFR